MAVATDSRSQPEGEAPLAVLLAARERFLAYVRARIADADLAEDILQDALLKALKAAPSLRDEAALVPWFYRVLGNAITDAHRRRGASERRQAVLEAHFQEGEAPSEPELCECFRGLLPELHPTYAEVIERLDLASEEPADYAARAGLTMNSLKVRRHRARQALRRQLELTCRTCAEHACLDCSCRSDAARPGRA